MRRAENGRLECLRPLIEAGAKTLTCSLRPGMSQKRRIRDDRSASQRGGRHSGSGLKRTKRAQVAKGPTHAVIVQLEELERQSVRGSKRLARAFESYYRVQQMNEAFCSVFARQFPKRKLRVHFEAWLYSNFQALVNQRRAGEALPELDNQDLIRKLTLSELDVNEARAMCVSLAARYSEVYAACATDDSTAEEKEEKRKQKKAARGEFLMVHRWHAEEQLHEVSVSSQDQEVVLHVQAMRFVLLQKHYSGSRFLEHVAVLLLRYRTACGARDVGSGGNQAALEVNVFRALQHEFGVSVECFASPFNTASFCVPGLRYCSAFNVDKQFGSLGSFWSFEPSGRDGVSLQCNPPFVPSVVLRMSSNIDTCLLEAQKNGVPCSFIVIIPSWDGTEQQQKNKPQHQAWTSLANSKFCVRHVRVGQHAHAFQPGLLYSFSSSKHKRMEQNFFSNHDSSVFFLQNPLGRNKFPVTDRNVNALLASFS
jgi:hypothetical protein